MYNVVFNGDSGKNFLFGAQNNVVFDMDLAAGLSVNIATSQGFSQIGVNVGTRSVQGKTINVSGCIYGDISAGKKQMSSVFSPFSSGKLVFNSKYFIRVFVKDTPSFSPIKTDGRFSMRFFAPFPFFTSVESISQEIGELTKTFQFPTEYTQHIFGEKSTKRYLNIVNSGDISVPFDLTLRTTSTSVNPMIQNMTSLEFLKFNGTIYSGDELKMYRDSDGILRAYLKREEEVQDVISWIDGYSSLFHLSVGDNLILATDENGGTSLTARIGFCPAVGGVYES